MRVDFFHTGGAGSRSSPSTAWRRTVALAGAPGARADSGRAGDYRFEVRDPAATCSMRAASPRSTASGSPPRRRRRQHRTFHESLRFPVPAGPVEVTVQRQWRRQSLRDGMAYPGRPRRPVPAACAAGTTAADRRRAARRAGRQGRRAAGRRRLHGCRMRGEVRSGRTPHGRCACSATNRLRHGAPISTCGACARRPSVGHRASVHRHRNAARRVGSTYDVFGSERYVLTFDNRDAARHRRVGALRVHHHPGERRRPTVAAASSACSPPSRSTTTGRTTCSSTSSGTTSPGSPTSTTPRPWPTSRPPGRRAVASQRHGAARRRAAQVARPRPAADTPLPTPWPKAGVRSRGSASSRRGASRLRAENRPESEMNALFREEQGLHRPAVRGRHDRGRSWAPSGAPTTTRRPTTGRSSIA